MHKFLILLSKTVCNKNIDKFLTLADGLFLLGITNLNQKLIYKDDIKIFNELDVYWDTL